MKNNALVVLLVVAGLSAMLSVGLCWSYILRAGEYNRLRKMTAHVNQRVMVVQALVNDTMEYSKKNPAIDPLLESVGLKQPKSAATATNRPATK